MATYTKSKLSGSTDCKAIKIAASATPGTTVHTAVSGTVNMDELWLWVTNNHSTDVNLTIEFGGANTEDKIQLSVPKATGLYLVVPGLVLQNSQVIRAFASVVNVLSIHGFINAITV